MVEELASGAKLEHQVQVLVRAERLHEVYNAGVLQLRKDLSLKCDLLKLAIRKQFFNLDNLHGAEGPCALLADQNDARKSPLADLGQQLVVSNARPSRRKLLQSVTTAVLTILPSW